MFCHKLLHTYKCTFHRSITVSQRKQDVEYIISVQKVQNIYTVVCYKHFAKQYYGLSLYINNSCEDESGIYLSTVLMLL
jgi:hypothetical protein